MHNPNDPSLTSWVESAQGSDFSIQNLPFGIYQMEGITPRAASAIGDQVVDLYMASALFSADWKYDRTVFLSPSLNAFISLGREAWKATRRELSLLLMGGKEAKPELASRILIPMHRVEMLLPVEIGDYTDFYSSIDHATNVGIMFRGKENALMPNWKWLPVGYHGRASSVVVSGTNLHRPKGQTSAADDQPPVFGPSRLVDFELEMGYIVGQGNALGDAVSTEEAEGHIFGLCLFNDWSARDIQRWEYVPLGPFLAKNFGSTISPWIVTMEALEPFRVPGYVQDPAPLEYLQTTGDRNFDLNLEVFIQPEGKEETRVCQSNFKYMYWSIAQQVAHHTVNGCNLRVGDLLASGTLSGPEPSSFGSMLELSWRGTQPVPLNDGSERKFIQDGDTVIIRGHGIRNGVRVGFGEVRSKILPAK
ncbi:MAG: fumarylacetoacetase [Bacteroidia bacterium]|nr:fumarylacetoacetase [Bacteroidia bacterium]